MEINKIEFLDISVELPVSIDVDLRTDFYYTEWCKLIEQINFLKSVVKKLCIANGNTIVVKRSEPVQYTDVMKERLEIGELGFINKPDFVKISDKTLVL